MTREAGYLDPRVESVLLQIPVGKTARIPQWLPPDNPKIKTGKNYPESIIPGVQFIQKTPNIRVSALPGDLMNAGLELVHARQIERIATYAPGTYFVISYIFAREKRQVSEDWRRILDEHIYPDLLELVSRCWYVRCYRNPYYQDGQLVPGKHAISINCEQPSSFDMAEDKVRGELVVDTSSAHPLILLRPLNRWAEPAV